MSSKARRALQVLAAIVIAAVLYMQCRTRPANLPLVTSIDGPTPSAAKGVVIFLHGYGGGITRAEEVARRLRQAGLPSDVSIVLIEAPFSTGLGHSWGLTTEDQTTSRARLRARLTDLLGEHGPPPSRVVIAGFSQGAGLAIDVAVEDPRIGAVASFSPCLSALRGELPKRDIRVLLAHGTRDTRCPVNESHSLAQALAAAGKPAQYIEFDGGHVVPPEAIRALVTLAGKP